MKRVFSRITAANMRKQFSPVALVILAMSALAACTSNPEAASISGDVKVLAPMNDPQSSKYILQFVELNGITNLAEVTGRFARFFFSPRISQNRLGGVSAKGHFLRNTDGNFVPMDDLSQQMVAIYAHMQSLAQLDAAVGAAGVNKWPRDIGLGVVVKGSMSNNAFYDGKTDSMLFVPYTQSDLPISVNGGILAHEHFHSLFYKIVLRGSSDEASIHDRQGFLKVAGVETLDARTVDSDRSITESSNETDLHQYYHSSLVRGMNEGLADFWGWMYTGNPDFIAASLPQEKGARTLEALDKVSVAKLPKTTDLKRAVGIYLSYDKENVSQYLTGYAYTVGTQFSRMMKGFTDISAQARGLKDLEARRKVATWLIRMLPGLRADLAKIQDGSYYQSTQFVQSLTAVIPDLQEKECLYLADVFNNTSASTKKMICKQETNWKLVEE